MGQTMATTRTRTRTAPQSDIFKIADVRGTVIKTEGLEETFPVLKSQTSRQVEDEFQGFSVGSSSSDLSIIEPLYPPSVLNRYCLASGVLRTCIGAIVTNVDGFGYTLEYIGPEGAQDSPEAQEEKARAEGVLDHPNGEYSMIDLRKRFRHDKESCGYGTIEIVRNEDDGFPDIIHHVPSYTIRMTGQDKEASDAYRYMPRPGAKNNMMLVKTRFRRYVQSAGSSRVYFRENGDTRAISVRNGRASGGPADNNADLASDMVLDCHYTPGSKYGAPRWIGELRSVLGIQESENTNLAYFKDNGIPAMMLLVLGGALTTQAQMDFKRLVTEARGSGMQNKIVMMEVKGDMEAASDKGQIQRPEVKLEPLLQVRQQDAFFQNFEENAGKKVRSSFRLPAILTGLTEEVTYAVAAASLTLAESQIFAPERNQTDDLFNYQILTYNGEPMRYWRMKSNPPRIQDSDGVMKAITTLEAVGAMTPNIAIEIANGLFDMEIEKIDAGWGDMPFSLMDRKIDPDTGTFADAPEPPQQPDNVVPFPAAAPGTQAPPTRAERAALREAARTKIARAKSRKGAKRSQHRDAHRVPTLKTVQPAHPVRKSTRPVDAGSARGDDAGRIVDIVPEDPQNA